MIALLLLAGGAAIIALSRKGRRGAVMGLGALALACLITAAPAVLAPASTASAVAECQDDNTGLIAVSPLTPTLVPAAACGIEASVTTPVLTGVGYSQSRVGDIVTVTAAPQSGYVLAAGAQTVWEFDVSPTACQPIEAGVPVPMWTYPPVCNAPVEPIIPDAAGVIHTRTDDSATGQTTITATVAPGYVLAPGSVTSWTFSTLNITHCGGGDTPEW